RARQAVGDDGRSQSVIRTAHGRGVMWVAPVEVESMPRAAEPAAAARTGRARPDAPPKATTARYWPWLLLALLALTVIAFAAYRVMFPPSTTAATAQAATREYSVALKPIAGEIGSDLAEAGPALLAVLLARDGIRLLQADDGDATDWQQDSASLHQRLGVDA